MLLALLFALAQYPPLGKLVDVGGYRVHIYCTGEGSPAVAIVGGGYSFDWGLVQPEVAKFTRVCTYDAGGTAWSDPGKGHSCSGRVEEVHRVLNNAGVEGPYVLTGLSIGALVARLYAAKYPGEVAGMVMVDHAFLDPVGARAGGSVTGLDSAPALIGQTPIEITIEDSSAFENLPERARELHRWAVSLRPPLPHLETARDCVSEIGSRTLGAMPLVVVSTANNSSNYGDLQTRLLALSKNSWQMVAKRSFHSVEIDQPEVVVRAIRRVVEAARKK
jgi:pimeloyl-ACP methyl ester carboxylesterase